MPARALLYALACLLLLEGPKPPVRPPKFRTLSKGSFCRIYDRSFRIIVDPEEWRQIWPTIPSVIPSPEAPRVDFDAEMVICAFKGTVGHPDAFAIVDVSRSNDDLVVDIWEKSFKPEPGMLYPAMAGEPFHIIAVPRRSAAAPTPLPRRVIFRTEGRDSVTCDIPTAPDAADSAAP